MDAWFWAWVAFAALLIAAEAVTGRITVWPFALGATCAAAVDLIGMGAGQQWAALALVASLGTVVARRLIDTPQRPSGGE